MKPTNLFNYNFFKVIQKLLIILKYFSLFFMQMLSDLQFIMFLAVNNLIIIHYNCKTHLIAIQIKLKILNYI